jgi:hypothetical protein
LYSKGKNFKLTTLVILNLNKPLKLKGRSFNKEKAVQPIASFGEAKLIYFRVIGTQGCGDTLLPPKGL